MAETIYTIPVNEAFDQSKEEQARCPFCRLYEKLQNNELELILGASMMEPDIRIQTNKLGFCGHHYGKMFERGNRLGLGLILESHLNEVRADLKGGVTDLVKGKGGSALSRLEKLGNSCYVCSRIEHSLSKMLENALYLWESDSAFQKKVAAQPMFCLPHYERFTSLAKAKLSKKAFAAFYETVDGVMGSYFDTLREDVSWFCKKFDYRYEEEPWGNSKDSVERAIRFLSSEH